MVFCYGSLNGLRQWMSWTQFMCLPHSLGPVWPPGLDFLLSVLYPPWWKVQHLWCPSLSRQGLDEPSRVKCDPLFPKGCPEGLGYHSLCIQESELSAGQTSVREPGNRAADQFLSLPFLEGTFQGRVALHSCTHATGCIIL